METTVVSGYENTIITPILSTGQQCTSSVRLDGIAPNSWFHLNLVGDNTEVKCPPPNQNSNGKYNYFSLGQDRICDEEDTINRYYKNGSDSSNVAVMFASNKYNIDDRLTVNYRGNDTFRSKIKFEVSAYYFAYTHRQAILISYQCCDS